MKPQNCDADTTYTDMRRALAAELLKAVDSLNSTAIAIKRYDTAVGVKEALVYLANFGPAEQNYLLQGEYYSEGRNVLAASSVMVPKTAGPDQVKLLAGRFAAGAEKQVLQSYAARLLRLQRAEEIESMDQGDDFEGSAPGM